MLEEKKKDLYISLFLLLFSIVFFASTYNLQRLTESNIGVEFFPRLTAIAIFILSSALFVQSITGLKKYKRNNSGNVKVEKNDYKKYFTVLLTVLLIIAYIALMWKLGFIISTAIYLFLQISVLAPKEKRSYVTFFIISVLTSCFIYYVFKVLLHLMLPAGILG